MGRELLRRAYFAEQFTVYMGSVEEAIDSGVQRVITTFDHRGDAVVRIAHMMDDVDWYPNGSSKAVQKPWFGCEAFGRGAASLITDNLNCAKSPSPLSGYVVVITFMLSTDAGEMTVSA